MVRLFGAGAIGFCALYMGISFSRELQLRVLSVSALRDMLLLWRQKLSSCGLPLPALLRESASENADCFSVFCTRAAVRLERDRRKTAERILTECFCKEAPNYLPEEALRCALRVFAVLGKLDDTQQETALDRAVEELDRLESRLREDHRRRSRCYAALGVCGGLAITLLLV